MKTTKSKLGNPLVAAEVVTQTATAIPFLIKLLAVTTVVVVVYKTWTNRFINLKESNNEPPSNISLAQAKVRADSIASSIGYISNDFANVSKQLTGLNYNGFVRVYNAFGHHRGTLLGGELNLIEWLQNQFGNDSFKIKQLSFLLNGKFF
jgi:hypothetical protein